jgi:hypothetical protein
LLNLYNYVLDSNQIKQNFINISSQVFSVRDLTKEETVLPVYPNPAQDIISIDLKKLNDDGPVQVSIYNMTGSTVYQDQVSGSNQQNIKVKTSSFPAGIYFVRAESETKISGQKLIIRR